MILAIVLPLGCLCVLGFGVLLGYTILRKEIRSKTPTTDQSLERETSGGTPRSQKRKELQELEEKVDDLQGKVDEKLRQLTALSSLGTSRESVMRTLERDAQGLRPRMKVEKTVSVEIRESYYPPDARKKAPNRTTGSARWVDKRTASERERFTTVTRKSSGCGEIASGKIAQENPTPDNDTSTRREGEGCEGEEGEGRCRLYEKCRQKFVKKKESGRMGTEHNNQHHTEETAVDFGNYPSDPPPSGTEEYDDALDPRTTTSSTSTNTTSTRASPLRRVIKLPRLPEGTPSTHHGNSVENLPGLPYGAGTGRRRQRSRTHSGNSTISRQGSASPPKRLVVSPRRRGPSRLPSGSRSVGGRLRTVSDQYLSPESTLMLAHMANPDNNLPPQNELVLPDLSSARSRDLENAGFRSQPLSPRQKRRKLTRSRTPNLYERRKRRLAAPHNRGRPRKLPRSMSMPCQNSIAGLSSMAERGGVFAGVTQTIRSDDESFVSDRETCSNTPSTGFIDSPPGSNVTQSTYISPLQKPSQLQGLEEVTSTYQSPPESVKSKRSRATPQRRNHYPPWAVSGSIGQSEEKESYHTGDENNNMMRNTSGLPGMSGNSQLFVELIKPGHDNVAKPFLRQLTPASLTSDTYLSLDLAASSSSGLPGSKLNWVGIASKSSGLTAPNTSGGVSPWGLHHGPPQPVKWPPEEPQEEDPPIRDSGLVNPSTPRESDSYTSFPLLSNTPRSSEFGKPRMSDLMLPTNVLSGLLNQRQSGRSSGRSNGSQKGKHLLLDPSNAGPRNSLSSRGSPGLSEPRNSGSRSPDPNPRHSGSSVGSRRSFTPPNPAGVPRLSNRSNQGGPRLSHRSHILAPTTPRGDPDLPPDHPPDQHPDHPGQPQAGRTSGGGRLLPTEPPDPGSRAIPKWGSSRQSEKMSSPEHGPTSPTEANDPPDPASRSSPDPSELSTPPAPIGTQTGPQQEALLDGTPADPAIPNSLYPELSGPMDSLQHPPTPLSPGPHPFVSSNFVSAAPTTDSLMLPIGGRDLEQGGESSRESSLPFLSPRFLQAGVESKASEVIEEAPVASPRSPDPTEPLPGVDTTLVFRTGSDVTVESINTDPTAL